MVHVMFITLSQMRHYIRTSFGDSKQAYTQSTIRFHGIGQGNGAGPMIWVMVSSPILESLRANNCGINISTSDDPSGLISAFTFVDDNDMVQEIKSTSNISIETQKALDIWTEGLHTSGGACAPEKSSWTTIIHNWKNDKWNLAKPSQTIGILTIKDKSGDKLVLPQHPAEEANAALGIMFSPSGQQNSQFRHLQDKCKQWAFKINKSKLTRSDSFLAMTTTIWKTIEYPLLATTMSMTQCSNLAGIILMAGLPRSGICRYIDRRPLFSCTKFQGFGLKHPYFIQGLKKLEHIFDLNDCTSQLLVSEAFATTALTSGLGIHFMKYNAPNIVDILEQTWIRSLWEYCSHYNITFVTHEIRDSRYQHDDFIMNRLSKVYKGSHLKKLNFCRIYLQIKLLSDMFTTDSKRILPHIWNGNLQINHNDLRKWPHQPKPSRQAWNLWRSSLQTVFNLSTTGQNPSPWNTNYFIPIRWTWFYHESTNRIYEK
jgi:hypothetical protein